MAGFAAGGKEFPAEAERRDLSRSGKRPRRVQRARRIHRPDPGGAVLPRSHDGVPIGRRLDARDRPGLSLELPHLGVARRGEHAAAGFRGVTHPVGGQAQLGRQRGVGRARLVRFCREHTGNREVALPRRRVSLLDGENRGGHRQQRHHREARDQPAQPASTPARREPRGFLLITGIGKEILLQRTQPVLVAGRPAGDQLEPRAAVELARVPPVPFPGFRGLAQLLLQPQPGAVGLDPLVQPRPRPQQGLVGDHHRVGVDGQQPRGGERLGHGFGASRIRQLPVQRRPVGGTAGIVLVLADPHQAQQEGLSGGAAFSGSGMPAVLSTIAIIE